MNATKNYIGKNRNSRRQKAKTTSSTSTAICGLDEAEQGHLRNSKRPTEISPKKPIANGFLKTTFLPKFSESKVWKESKNVQNKRQNGKSERSFYQSLSQLLEHYGVNPIPTEDLEFPYNATVLLWNIEQQLRNKVENWNHLALIKQNEKLTIVSEERCDTGTSLFYIPVVPLYKMLQDKKRKKTAHLLLSVCAYLYRNVGVPHYREEDSYLYWMYEMLNDWIEQDDDREEIDIHKKELKTAQIIGEIMEKKIANKQNLIVFSERLKVFKSKNEFDHECFYLAEKVFQLYQQYPENYLYKNAHFNNTVNYQIDFEENDYDDEKVITMDKYISFYADDKGLICDNIIEMVNNEFNEYGEVQEPIISKVFDGKLLHPTSLDFESRLFELMNQLIYILSNNNALD